MTVVASREAVQAERMPEPPRSGIRRRRRSPGASP